MTRRTERVNGLVRLELSRIVTEELRDPRLSRLISITRVETSPDLQHARVFVSVLGEAKEKKRALKALKAASGFIHRNLRGRVTLRRVPSVEFHIDESIEQGDDMLRLMDEISAKDADGPPDS